MEEEFVNGNEKNANTLASKAWRVFKHICRGLFLVFIIRLTMGFIPSECKYFDENGAEIVQGYSLHKGYARQIEFRNNRYMTHIEEQEKLRDLCRYANFWGFQTFARLKDGKIFVAGANEDFYDMTDDTWICDPIAETKVAGPKMTVKCIRPTLTALKDGRILLTGGFRDDKSGPIDTISIYDPATSKITQIGKLLQGRAEHSCLQMNSHEVLVACGKVEKYSPSNPGQTTGTVELIDLNTGKSKLLQITRAGSSPFVIRDGNKNIHVIGGFYATKTMGDTRWHSQVTKLDISRDQVD